ncbi:hypothetical protein EWM64_g4227 [Hericium alpestre]|uniref:RlpA-like protein double-psi beta-barrel domain-containing protein n=1 Tax=Hericium alpestre TaxID=135208 RepID=A0A4Z0A1R7_9AGAM|nr:hypothetical protein EWM64_g4227 [Hericium alpestre]
MVALTYLSLFTLFSTLALAAPLQSRANSGQATFYVPGIGACGKTNAPTDMIAAVSGGLFDTFPGAGANPNTNPTCTKQAKVIFKGKSVTVGIVDRCVACNQNDLDLSPSAFSQLADQSLGRIDMTWEFV